MAEFAKAQRGSCENFEVFLEVLKLKKSITSRLKCLKTYGSDSLIIARTTPTEQNIISDFWM